MRIVKNIRLVLLLIAVCLIAYSYHPGNFDSAGKIISNSYNKYALVMIAASFILSIGTIKNSISIQPIRVFLILLGVVSLSFMLLYSLNLVEGLHEVRALLISFIALLFGTMLKCNNKEILTISFFYIIAVLLVGYLQITQNIGDFVIEDTYINTAKNAFGPMIAIAGVLSVLIAFTHGYNKLVRVFMAVTAIIALIEVATVRARLVTITFILLFLFILFKYFKVMTSKNKGRGSVVIYLVVLITILAIIFSSLQEYIWNSLIQNKEGDFTSGRLTAYYDGMDIFLSSPFFGNLVLQEKVGWVHNYLLLNLSTYGLVFSLPLLVLYFYLVYVIILGLKKRDLFIPQNFGYIIILISFIVSLGEPTYPYGPGTTNFLPFLLLGVSLNHNKYNKI